MPYNNYGNYGNSNRNGNYTNNRNGSQGGYQNNPVNTPRTTAAMPLPADYVDKAEEIMSRLMSQHSRLTTTKLRSILSIVSDIYNREVGRLSEKELSAEDQTAVQMLRVRIAYETKRDNAVGTFVQEAHLLEYIKGLGRDRKKFLAFSHYMEALVAYHRYYGGSEK